MRVAFATCSDFPDGWQDDHAAARLLDAEFRIWNDPCVDWAAYDRVVIRSAWDYTASVDAFLSWSDAVGAERLRNVPRLVGFNADKRYLAELSAPTVPTVFVAPGDPLPVLRGEVVVKPNISAGARDTGRFGRATHDEARALVARIQAGGRVALVEPYMAAVDEHGETSLVFLGGELSHVLRKRAVPERELAHAVMAEICDRFGTPLYARVDLVTDPGGKPVLLELEAIEPELYLNTSPGASERMASAILAS